MSLFKGAFTALVTPLKKGEVDYERLAALVEFQISEGISGIIPCGTTGESVTLTYEEQHRVIEFVVREVQGRVPVIAGAGTNATRDAIMLATNAKKAGASAILSVTPYYNRPSQEGLYQHFMAIAKEVDIPIILYNVPSRTGVSILPPTVARLSKNSNIVGIKEATGDLKQVSEIIDLVGPDFTVLSGDDLTTLPLLAVGGTGAISVSSNIVPRDMSDMIAAHLSGNGEQAQKLNLKLLPINKAMFIETNPVPVKEALVMMKKIDLEFRLPLVPLADANREVLRKALKEYGLI